MRLIREWAKEHEAELKDNWQEVKDGDPLDHIAPLERLMIYMPTVVFAEYVSEYKIRLQFDDGTVGIVDFKRWLTGPVFEPLKDADVFTRFFVDGGTVTWPNGADIAPETLYTKAKSGESAA